MEIGRWYASDGWEHRKFVLPARGEAKGALLFLGGRGDFFEKYIEAIHHWSQQGWNVHGFDWRGQGGSGLTHPEKYCHASDFGRQLQDLAEFTEDLCRKTGKPPIAVGHSLGGHLVLRAAAEERFTIKAMVLLAPMLGIRTGRVSASMANRLGSIGRFPLIANRPVWKGQPRTNPGHLTSCMDRHQDKLWWKANHPEIARGGPTWRWVATATASMHMLANGLHESAPDTPALLLTGSRDKVVDNRVIARVASLLPKARLAEIEGGGHELLREADAARMAAFAQIDLFLDGVGL